MPSNDESRFLLNPDTAELMERVLYEVKRVVVGQDRFLERVMVALLAGGWLALRWGGGLGAVFAAQGAALVLYGLVNAWTIAGGAWFGPVGWPRSMAGLLRRMPLV